MLWRGTPAAVGAAQPGVLQARVHTRRALRAALCKGDPAMAPSHSLWHGYAQGAVCTAVTHAVRHGA